MQSTFEQAHIRASVFRKILFAALLLLVLLILANRGQSQESPKPAPTCKVKFETYQVRDIHCVGAIKIETVCERWKDGECKKLETVLSCEKADLKLNSIPWVDLKKCTDLKKQLVDTGH